MDTITNIFKSNINIENVSFDIDVSDNLKKAYVKRKSLLFLLFLSFVGVIAFEILDTNKITTFNIYYIIVSIFKYSQLLYSLIITLFSFSEYNKIRKSQKMIISLYVVTTIYKLLILFTSCFIFLTIPNDCNEKMKECLHL